jgi:hypothetical protein
MVAVWMTILLQFGHWEEVVAKQLLMVNLSYLIMVG